MILFWAFLMVSHVPGVLMSASHVHVLNILRNFGVSPLSKL